MHRAMDRVREVYLDWAEFPLERDCRLRTTCCRFRLTGRTPYLTRGEALVTAQAWRAQGERRVPEPADGSCPLLDPSTGMCRVYEARPFGCRTHFCEAAGGSVPRRDVREFIHRLEDIDTTLGGSGGVNLPTALRHAMVLLTKR